MSILRLPKAIDEITEATLLEEDWYDMVLKTDPAILPNGALKEWMQAEGVGTGGSPEEITTQLYKYAEQAANYENENGQRAGLNWVLSLRVEHTDPMIRGRAFKKYYGIPNKGDSKLVTPLGQTVEDSKLEAIKKCIEAFKGSTLDGATEEVELTTGDMASFYVVQSYNERFEREENSISMNQDPMPVG